MIEVNPEMLKRLEGFLAPWYQSIADPASAQQKVLQDLLKGYARTAYGRLYNADGIASVEDYRRSFPVMTYEKYYPLIQKVMEGDTGLMLYEEPLGWAITRGTTKNEPKFIPMTQTDIDMRLCAGRAMLNYVASTRDFGLLGGVNLNLNFPSVVGKIKAGERELEYGYSSGIYVKYVSTGTPIRSLPTQEEIDALGGGKTLNDWERRFELAYEKCKNENVTLVGGVAPTASLFARHLKSKHGIYPKELWKVKILTLGSVAGINTRYAPALRDYYGSEAVIREIYGATEGMFGQQMDVKRAWVPNYDLFFFEVITGGKTKMLHEMKPGENGSLVVSTPILARYRIGDIIRAFEPPYFRCIGRENWWTPLNYLWTEFASLNLGRL
ncbi:MAG: GH3 auxin-responsive promoter family protein [Dehalococcoidaceae bacterium]|nr:GH3 auxin-responsive promoter family protein [Dehalococcoidaceae bacterium]